MAVASFSLGEGLHDHLLDGALTSHFIIVHVTIVIFITGRAGAAGICTRATNAFTSCGILAVTTQIREHEIELERPFWSVSA